MSDLTPARPLPQVEAAFRQATALRYFMRRLGWALLLAGLAGILVFALSACGEKSPAPGLPGFPPPPSSHNLGQYKEALKKINPKLSDPTALTARNLCYDVKTDPDFNNEGRRADHAYRIYSGATPAQGARILAVARQWVCG